MVEGGGRLMPTRDLGAWHALNFDVPLNVILELCPGCVRRKWSIGVWAFAGTPQFFYVSFITFFWDLSDFFKVRKWLQVLIIQFLSILELWLWGGRETVLGDVMVYGRVTLLSCRQSSWGESLGQRVVCGNFRPLSPPPSSTCNVKNFGERINEQNIKFVEDPFIFFFIIGDKFKKSEN